MSDADRVPLEIGVALVTGGGGGVGRAAALALAKRGHDVALLGRTLASLETVAAEIEKTGRRALALSADVADRGAVEAAVSRARRELGPVLVLVGTAGTARSSPLLPPDDALFDATMATNVRGAWVVTTACLPDMLAARRGRVVHVASTAALQGYRYVAAYVASKHALLGLCRAMALDLEGKGVAVHAVCPGFLDTPMTEKSLAAIMSATGRSKAQALADLLKSAGQERLVSPSEVVEEILRLL